MNRTATTLEDIYRLALPGGTRIVYGDALMRRPVSWACSLRPSPPAFPKLAGDELALIDMDDLRQLDSRMRLDRVIQSLRQAEVAAVAIRGEMPEDAARTAESQTMPLLALPSTEALLQVERSVIRLIVDREGYIAARAADLQRELTQIELDGGGLDAIVARLQQFIQQPVLVLRDDGQLAAVSGLEDLSSRRRDRIVASLPNITALRSWAASHEDALNRAVGFLPLVNPGDDSPYDRAVVAAVVAAERIQGYCLVLSMGNGESRGVAAAEGLAVGQGAGAAALEWSRQHAVGAVQERMRAAFLDDLLASEIADEEAWIQRGHSLGYDLSLPYTAWIVEAKGVSDWPAPLELFLHERREAIPLSHRGESMLFFWPTDNPKSGRHFKSLAIEMVETLLAGSRRASVVIGIGRPAAAPSEWLRSLQQARESWRMGKSWGAAPVTYFGDLGLYQLLTALGGNREAARFFRKTLQPLIDHDENRNAELVQTLDTFFSCHGNLSQTAARLHIHRNTLAYRLERIAAITRLDLDDPDARFSLQLALKLRPVMGHRLS